MNTLNLKYVVLAVLAILLIGGGIVLTKKFNAPTAAPFMASSTQVVADIPPTASSTPATTTQQTIKPVVKKPVAVVKPVPVVIKPTPKPVVAQTTTVTVTPTGPSISTTPYTVTNTLKVSPIALLTGGTTRTGATIPVSYLQITNQSTSTVSIKGFTVKQQGTTPDAGVIAFSSVDDKGMSRGTKTGSEGVGVLTNGSGYVPSTAVLGAGQMKLFTLKATLSTSAQYIGTTLTLVVTGVDAGLPLTASLPIRGTTWTISAQ